MYVEMTSRSLLNINDIFDSPDVLNTLSPIDFPKIVLTQKVNQYQLADARWIVAKEKTGKSLKERPVLL